MILLVVIIITTFLGSMYVLFTTDAEYEVYKVVLESLQDKVEIDTFSLSSQPSTCRGAKQESISNIDKSVFDDFYKNNNPITAQPKYISFLDKKYHAVSTEDNRRIYSDKKTFLKEVSIKLINLSRVGFDSDKKFALICVESSESGDLVYLQKLSNHWYVIKWTYVW